MAEHQMKLEMRKLDVEERRQDQIHNEIMASLQDRNQTRKRGQWIGLLFGLVAMALSVFLITTGATAAQIAGVATLITEVAGLVGLFLWATARSRSDANTISILDLRVPPRLSRPRTEDEETKEP